MSLERRLLDLAGRQHALVARRQTTLLGASRDATVHLFDDHPRWETLTDQVLRLRGAPVTDAQAAMAAVLDSGPGAHLSHLAAGNRWGLSCSLHPFHVVTTSSSRRQSALARTHKVRDLPDTWTTRLDGIPIVRPELLALQIYAVARDVRAETLVEHLWSLRVLSGGSIAAFLSQLGERGRNGTAGLRRYLEPRGLDYQPAATNLEMRAISILDGAGIAMRRQVNSGGEQWTGRVDLRHETLPLIVEVQSDRYHEALAFRSNDRRRRNLLEANGFTVVEVWESQVWYQPWEVVAKVLAKAREATTKANSTDSTDSTSNSTANSTSFVVRATAPRP